MDYTIYSLKLLRGNKAKNNEITTIIDKLICKSNDYFIHLNKYLIIDACISEIIKYLEDYKLKYTSDILNNNLEQQDLVNFIKNFLFKDNILLRIKVRSYKIARILK